MNGPACLLSEVPEIDQPTIHMLCLRASNRVILFRNVQHFFSADFSAVSAVTSLCAVFLETGSLMGFVVLELTLDFFVACQKTCSKLARPLHHASSSKASRLDGLSSPQAQASGDAERALAPFGGSPGWPDEDDSDCDGYDVIVLYVPQPASRAHPCCRDCGDRPGRYGHPPRGL